MPLRKRDGLVVLKSFLVAKKSSLKIYKTNQRFIIAENISGVLFYLFGSYALEWYSYSEFMTIMYSLEKLEIILRRIVHP